VPTLSLRPERWTQTPPVLGDRTFARATTRLEPPGERSSAEAPGAARRSSEFAAGRLCAAEALLDAGSRELTVGVGVNRTPNWPAGFVGSITHTRSLAWAAVGRAADFRSLGIDSEPVFDDTAMREAVPVALDAGEQRFVQGEGGPTVASVIFSAKESLYKCLNPCVGVFFDFDDARVEWIEVDGRARGSLVLRLQRDLADGFHVGMRFNARYAIASGHVHTAVELRR
jgi:enterobactin synthetase component D